MKKIASLIVAGALMLTTTGGAMAAVTQGNFGTVVTVTSSATSTTGLNSQFGGGFQLTSTGTALSNSSVQSVANQNGAGLFVLGNTTQTNAMTLTSVSSDATSRTGRNTQVGLTGGVKTVQTGNTESNSGIAQWANINLTGMTMLP